MTSTSEHESGREDLPRLSANVRRGVLWSVLRPLLLRSANIVVTAIVAHILSPRDFGIFAVALTAFAITSSIANLGIAACLLRADLNIDVLAPTMVTVSITVISMLAGAMVIFAAQIAAMLGSVDAAGPIRVMALALFLTGIYAVPWDQLVRDFRQNKIFLAYAMGFIPSKAALLFLARSGNGAMAFAWSEVINEFFVMCVILASVHKRYWPGFAREAFSVLFRIGLPLGSANIIAYILMNVDYAFVGHLMGAVALGIYTLAFNVASWPAGLFGSAIDGVSMPAISRVKDDPGALQSAVIDGLRALLFAVVPICGLMMVLSHSLVLTLYGAKWVYSASVLEILSLYGMFSMICVLFGNMLAGAGRAGRRLFVQTLWLCTLVPAMAVGVHLRGIVGAAEAHVAVIGFIVFPCYLLMLRQTVGVRVTAVVKAMVGPVIATAAASLAAVGAASLFQGAPARLVSGIAVGGLVYVVVAGPQGVALLGQDHAARLRQRLPLRLHGVAVRQLRVAFVSSGKHAASSKRRAHAKHSGPSRGFRRGSANEGIGGARSSPEAGTRALAMSHEFGSSAVRTSRMDRPGA